MPSFLLHLNLSNVDEETTVWCHPDDPDDWSTYTNETVVVYRTKGTLNEIGAIAKWASQANLAVLIPWSSPPSMRLINPKIIFILAEKSLDDNPVSKLALGHLVSTETAKTTYINDPRGCYFAYSPERKPPQARVYGCTDEEDREQRAVTRPNAPKCINCTMSLVPGEETLCSLCVMACHTTRRSRET